MTRFIPINNTPASKWHPEQEALLRKHYPTMPWPELLALLAPRSRRSIYGKAHGMHLVRVVEGARQEHQNFNIHGIRVLPGKVRAPTAAAPVLNSTVDHKKHPYNGAELLPYQGRPGAMDAYALPSLVSGQRVERAAP